MNKYTYRVKRYLNSIPKVEIAEHVEVPESVPYGNIIILTNAHNRSFKPEERFTLAMAEKESERFGKITILSGKNAGNVYNHVPYYGGNFHFNEYKGDTFFGVNFNREDEKKDITNKNSMTSVSAACSIVEKQNENAVQYARNLMTQIFSRPEY